MNDKNLIIFKDAFEEYQSKLLKYMTVDDMFQFKLIFYI